MTRIVLLAPLALLAACNVSENQNGSATISLDENRIEQGTDILANEAAKATAKAENLVENAAPELQQSARDIKERAGRVADKADALGEEIDRSTTTPAEANSAR